MNENRDIKPIKIISIFLIIIGIFVTFFLGYIIPNFPYICAIGGFFLILIGCFVLYLIQENNGKYKKYEKQLIENNKFIACVFLFIGIILIIISIIGIINGEFSIVWEEPLLYIIIGIIMFVFGLYYLNKPKKK